MIVADLGYERDLVLESPPPSYLERFGQTRVLTSRGPLPELAPLASLRDARGELFLYAIDGAAPADPRIETDEPLLRLDGLAVRADRGVGIDGSVLRYARTSRRDAPEGRGELPSDSRTLGYVLSKLGVRRVHRLLEEGWISPIKRPRVTIVDTGFEGWERIGVEAPRHFPIEAVEEIRAGRSERFGDGYCGHGTLVAAVVSECLRGCDPQITLRSILPRDNEQLYSAQWLGPLGIAWAVATAVEEDRADVVVLAMSHPSWGSPRFLRRILRAASLPVRGRRPGTALVCSVGDGFGSRTLGAGAAVALGADELSAQPWVIGVGATDEDGAWCRRHRGPAAQKQDPVGRFGPSVCVSAPGFYTILPDRYGDRTIDDSSLACALVGGVVGLTRSVSELRPQALKELLARTAGMPREVDPAHGLGARAGNEVDRTGHNFKLGFGEINALAAFLAAADPVSMSFVLASPRGSSGPGWRRFQRAPQMLLAQTLLHWSSRDPRPSKLLSGYRLLRPELVEIALGDPEVKEQLLWLGRHLGALLGDRCRAKRWRLDRDHSALIDRLESLLEIVAEHAERAEGPLAELLRGWCAEALAALPRDPAGSVRVAKWLANEALNFEPRLFEDAADTGPRGRPS